MSDHTSSLRLRATPVLALGVLAIGFAAPLIRRLGPNLPTMAFLGVPCAVGATLLLGTAWLVDVPIDVPSTRALGFITLAALVPQLVGHGALTYALGSLRPTVVGMATVGEPVISTLLAFLFLHEALDALTAFGCAITLGGVFLALSRTPQDKPVKKRSKIEHLAPEPIAQRREDSGPQG